MAWIKAANGNVFEVEDPDLVVKVVREGADKDGKPTHTAWETDPRKTGAKPWKQADTSGSSE